MRTTTKIQVKYAMGDVLNSLEQSFKEQGFRFKTKKNGMWQKGAGFLTAPQIFRFYQDGDKLCVESWLPFALLPGVYIGESGLDATMGFAVKASMKKVLQRIIDTFMLEGTEVEGYNPANKSKGKK